jgi:preprotein translocase subunit SecD
VRRKLWIYLGIIILITVFSFLIVWPKGPNLKIGSWSRELQIRKGLDLQGGIHLVYELDTSKIADKDKEQSKQGVVNIINRRINGLGLTEPNIQSGSIGNTQTVIVELPGVNDVNEAIDMIGKTAQLSFKEQNMEAIGTEDMWKDTGLNGSHLERANVEFDQQGAPQIGLQFNAEGRKLFGEITARNLEKPVAIFLDDQPISIPTVQSAITDGKAIITGEFKIDEAKKLALELNSGALPVPIKLIEQYNVEATLGNESVQMSTMAGIIGLILIAIFMIIYYRLFGLIAVAALIIYTLIVISLFKLIPVTLTLAGIAGFILSIGMAVDANILIFERIKEEKLKDKKISVAVEDGFRRAWPSIRDSNLSTLITTVILMWLGTGIIRGFAITLSIGVIVSMFTAITVSRTFLKLIMHERKTI